MAGSRRQLIVEADGGARGNPGPAAFGALVRDAETRAVLAERAERLGRATNNVAEYSGLVAGLTAAHEVDPDAAVEVRMDSKLVVEQMSGRWRINDPDLAALAAAARQAYDPGLVRYHWVPREQNAAADRLLNAVLDGRPSTSAASGVPPAKGDRPPSVDEGELTSPVEIAVREERVGPRNRIIGWATDLGTPTTFVLLRHGVTAHTMGRAFSGRGGADPALAEAGQTQAREAAAAIAARGDVTAVVSSPMLRCRQTAQASAGLIGVQVEIEDGFAEAAFGEWDAQTLEEVTARWPAQLDAWLASTAVAPPGGESLDAVAVRVRAARDRTIARHPGETVLVVTHVNPIKMLVTLALGAPATAIHHMVLGPASLSEVRYFPDGTQVLAAFSVLAHLSDLASVTGR